MFPVLLSIAALVLILIFAKVFSYLVGRIRHILTRNVALEGGQVWENWNRKERLVINKLDYRDTWNYTHYAPMGTSVLVCRESEISSDVRKLITDESLFLVENGRRTRFSWHLT